MARKKAKDPGQTGNLPEGLPERTLGWGILLWATRYIVQPDGETAGERWKFTREQVRFVLWYYAVDAKGRFAYRGATLRRAKGWGKSPLAALLCLAEFLGPVRFSRWAQEGEWCPSCNGGHAGKTWHPIGRSVGSPWIQIAATSYAQTANTFEMIRGMLVASRAKADYGLDVGKQIIQFRDGRPGKIEPVTASSESLEGGRPTFAIFEEPHHWTSSTGGHKVARTVRRNLGKISGGAARAVEVTNAHDPNRDSVAQHSYEAYLGQQEARNKRAADYLYDCREAPADVDLADEADLRRALKVAYGDSNWVDMDRLVAEIYDVRNPAEESRRFYLNQVVASSDSWLRPDQVDAAEFEGFEPADGDMIALGFDGSKSFDATALIACHIETGHCWPLGIWERPDGPEADGWTVPTDEVDDVVRSAFKRFDVVAFFADVAYWQSHVDTWAERYREKLAVRASPGHSVAFDMRGRTKDFTRAAEATNNAFAERGISFSDPDRKGLTRHLKNARRRPNAFGVGIGKEARESDRKVDAAVSLVIAREARRVAMERGRLENRRKREPGIVFGF